jgi:dephospho-CoA kinase
VSATWVFGYGSLVSPSSLGATLGRPVRLDDGGWFEAHVEGWGRRWNYGIGHVRGFWTAADGAVRELTLVALGVVPSPAESVNGVVVRVTADELARLDLRERDYDRVDVTDATSVAPDGAELDGPVVTYVPRSRAIEAFEQARDAGRAAIEQRYWDLVDGAFAALGPDRVERYHATTPAPEVPVLPIRRA